MRKGFLKCSLYCLLKALPGLIRQMSKCLMVSPFTDCFSKERLHGGFLSVHKNFEL